MSKTHWLKNPNKNYFGNWDIPESGELTLTIKSGGWETVKDPTTGKTQQKRVVHFNGNYKPLICNQTNAKSIVNSTGCRFIEDTIGKQITLFSTKVFDRKNKIEVDAVRIRNEKVKEVVKIKVNLTPDHDKWNTGVKFLSDGGSLENLKKGYSLSEENQERLLSDAMTFTEEKQNYEK